MAIIKKYWEHLSVRLKAEHPEGNPPELWSKAVSDSFSKKMLEKTGKTISHATIRRVFKEGHFGSIETRDMFAQFYGYKTHGDYINSEIEKQQKNKWIMFLLLGGLVITVCSYFFYAKTNYSPILLVEPIESTYTADDLLGIKYIIKKSIPSQLAAFKAIPKFEPYLDSLQEFYQKDSPAYLEILDILDGNTGHGWVINNKLNSSNAKLIGGIKIDSIFNNQAFVTTKEYWRLDWFSRISQQYEYLYEVTNDQQYILVKDTLNKNWKIISNIYTGDKFRFIPRYIHCDSISEKTISLEKVKKEVVIAVQNGGLDLSLKIICCYFNKSKDTTPTELSMLMNEKAELLRNVNTDRIDQSEFELRKKDLFKEILRFLEKLK